jgi:FtsP/CotA-like multicopper oxidase with cupredoxin domain
MGLGSGAMMLWNKNAVIESAFARLENQSTKSLNEERSADYTLHIRTSPIEVAPKRIISATTYNGQFPGPLLRFKEGREVVVDVYNDTDTPEQLHWHGQKVSTDVDGAAEEGTPFVPANGKRRLAFTPNPSGLRFYHSHNRAGANLAAGQYSGEVGPVYIEPKDEPGRYDREEFIVLKEFEPTFSRGGDMAQDFLSPAARNKTLEETGESANESSRRVDSLAKGMPHGYEVGYASFTINGRMLGHGEPIRVKQGQRVLFSYSKRERHGDSQPGAAGAFVSGCGARWQSCAASDECFHDRRDPFRRAEPQYGNDNDDRRHGMGIDVEYANHPGKPQWIAPAPFKWDYRRFAQSGATSPAPDETIEMTFAKDNAAEEGFHRWTINGTAFPISSQMSSEAGPVSFHVTKGKRYRIRMRNASDDIHPIHLHRHSFELNSIAGLPTAGIIKDVLMLGGYQEAEVSFVADNPGLTLFHCHQQLHMDFGFMALFDYT